MTFLITKNEIDKFSNKANSLKFLHQSKLPTVPSVIIPAYKNGDDVSVSDIGSTQYYYIRLGFMGDHIKRNEWRIVHKDDLKRNLADLATIAEESPADLIIQPFCYPIYSGAAFKAGNIIFVEMAYGLAQTVLHRGRFSYRAILVDQRIVCSETANQGVAMILDNNSMTCVPEYGWGKYNPDNAVTEIAKFITNTDNIVFEWGMINDSLVFFDHKEINVASGFFELNQSPPRIPLSVSTTIQETKEFPLPKHMLFLDYPDINNLSKARTVDFVIIKKGALLSHLSVYSFSESYKCVFQE